MSLSAGYGGKVALGAISTLVAQVFRVASSVGAIIVASRILSPTDYGIYAMAAPIAGFALLFQNVGFDQAVVQADDVSDDQLSSLFWLNIFLCLGLGCFLIALSPLVSRFYGNYESGNLVAAFSALILATAPNPLYNALLNRSMRFHAQSVVDIVSSVAMFGSTVIAALLLRSYWALLIGSIIATAASTICFLAMEKWRPKFTFRWTTISSMVRFGGGISANGFATYMTRNLDNILLAHFWGALVLGLYDRAYKLMLSPLQNFSSPLSRTLLPVLVRTRDDPERFRRAYLLFVQAIVSIGMPGIIAAAVGSHVAIPLLLGQRWLQAAPIFAWLSGAGALLLVNEAALWLLISTGRTRLLMQWGFFAATTVLVGFALGLPQGAIGMATAYFLGELLRTPILFKIASQSTPVLFRDLVGMHLTTVACAVASIGLRTIMPNNLTPLVYFSILVIFSYATAFCAQFLTEPGREILHVITSNVRARVTAR